MRRPLIAGNWKMNTTLGEGVELVTELLTHVGKATDSEVVLAPPFTSLTAVAGLIKDSGVKLAAQNMHYEDSGAFTGECSAEMIKSVGCDYVILGHSERREYFGETDETVNKKVIAALKAGLSPIVCVGESLAEREAGSAVKTVAGQTVKALTGLSSGMVGLITLAYEPLWAIGTGKTASPEDAEEVHYALRELLYESFDKEHTELVRILYGGSVKPDNIDTLMAKPNIDGALVGGASLKAEGFARIVNFQES